MIAGMAIIAASDFGTAVAPNLIFLLIARLGLGIGRAVSESGERGMLCDLASLVPELRGRALAAQQAVIALGIAIGAPLGGYVVEQYGVRASFLCVTAAALSAMVIYTFLDETVGKDVEREINGSSEVELSNEEETANWAKLLSDDQWRGLSLCQCGASFGFAAKIATIPVLAASILPGGAVGAGALLSAAGLSGLIGAPIGGWLTDRAGPRVSASLAGLVSASSLILVPVAMSPYLDLGTYDLAGGFNGSAAAFTALIIMWSIGASAQGPALTALAQELAPAGAEATAMALPRATGDGTYIVAPFILGLAADASAGVVPGAECAVAGTITLIGVIGLVLLSGLDNIGRVQPEAEA
uniref:Major facilitator superfamily (MFS) profile domain-containing protein n=1 Tax=Ditylum brightwellii TaxID=49249 RepID=A0A7S1ZKJ9_9STRA